jgi:hypothetical protein
MTASDQDNQSKSNAGAVATVAVCAVVLVAGMAYFVTYDWPSGKGVSLGDFLMFWFRELLALGIALVVLIAWAIHAVRGKSRVGRVK